MIKPLGNWILIKAVDRGEVTLASGIIVPGYEVAPESIQGEVIAIGPDVTTIHLGQIVAAPQFAPTAVKQLPSDKTYVVNEDDILAIIESDTAAK